MTLWIQLRNSIALWIACVSHGLKPTKSPRPHARTGSLVNYNVQKPFSPVARRSPHVNHVFQKYEYFSVVLSFEGRFQIFRAAKERAA